MLPQIKEYERTSTTVTNAYVKPLTGRYLSRLETRLESAVGGHVVLSDGAAFDTDTLVWTAGVKANPVLGSFGLPLDDKGRLRCLPTLEVDFSGLPAGLNPILSFESKALPDSPYWTEIKFKRAAADAARGPHGGGQRGAARRQRPDRRPPRAGRRRRRDRPRHRPQRQPARRSRQRHALRRSEREIEAWDLPRRPQPLQVPAIAAAATKHPPQRAGFDLAVETEPTSGRADPLAWGFAVAEVVILDARSDLGQVIVDAVDAGELADVQHPATTTSGGPAHSQSATLCA